MSQLILPNSIDAGTEIIASEHQANYVAIRDLINGNIEGGRSGPSTNIKEHSITGASLHSTPLYYGATSREMQAGVRGAGDLQVTPGVGLQLSVGQGFVWIQDSGLVAVGPAGNAASLVPAFISASSVTIAPNASGNPRIDQVIATLTDYGTATLSVLQGTATAAADLNNRSGAAALPASSIRLADILMPNGFGGPFVQTTHIRDRRPWALGFNSWVERTSSNITGTATAAPGTGLFSGGPMRMEIGANSRLVIIEASGVFQHSVSGELFMGVEFNASGTATIQLRVPVTAAANQTFYFWRPALFNAGSNLVNVVLWASAAGTYTVLGTTPAFRYRVTEVLAQNSDNSGA